MECSCNLRPGDLFPGVGDVCLRDNHYYYGLVCRAVVAFLPAVRFKVKVTRARLSSLYSRSLPMRLRLTEYYIHDIFH